MVLGLCRLLLRDPVEAEDATQQVFLSAHSAVLRGSRPREPHAWLATIARNECRARIHARMRESLPLPDLPSDLPDPLAAAIRATDLEAIWAAISSLPRRQRRVLVLREVGGLSYHELGRALGVSQASVESLLFRARRQVRALVAAATPLALRDDLARLISGFDPGSAGPAVKLTTAAVTLGLVATGASQIPEHHARPRVTAQASTSPHEPTVLAAARRPSALQVRSAPTHERNDSAGPDRPEREHIERAARHEQEHVRPAREPADVDPVEVDPVEVQPTQAEPRHGGDGSDGSSSPD